MPGGGAPEAEDQSRWSRYPNSQMGAIALIRQTLSDADWIQEVRSAAQGGSGDRSLSASTMADAFAPSCLEQLIRTDAAPRGLDLPSFEEFWARGFYETPLPKEPYTVFGGFRADPVAAPLKTPSGKIEIFSEPVAGFGYDEFRPSQMMM